MAGTNRLTHLDSRGRARMVDVGLKAPTRRRAVACGEIRMPPDVLRRILAGRTPKGDVLSVARVAGVMAAKRVDDLIPLCHSLSLDAINISFTPGTGRIRVLAEAVARGRTGVEMEAMTAAAIACLTIYDMAKALDKTMVIGPVCLLEKEGGKSGRFVRSNASEWASPSGS